MPPHAVVVGKADPLPGQRVEVRRLDMRVAVYPQRIGPLVIGDNEQNMGFVQTLGLRRTAEQREYEQREYEQREYEQRE